MLTETQSRMRIGRSEVTWLPASQQGSECRLITEKGNCQQIWSIVDGHRKVQDTANGLLCCMLYLALRRKGDVKRGRLHGMSWTAHHGSAYRVHQGSLFISMNEEVSDHSHQTAWLSFKNWWCHRNYSSFNGHTWAGLWGVHRPFQQVWQTRNFLAPQSCWHNLAV